MAGTPSIGRVLLPSASRTASADSGVQTNYAGYRGVLVLVDVTTVGTGSITGRFYTVDPIDGTTKVYLSSNGGALTANGENAYIWYPDLTTGTLSGGNIDGTSGCHVGTVALPEKWGFQVTANNANAITYSVSAYLLP